MAAPSLTARWLGRVGTWAYLAPAGLFVLALGMGVAASGDVLASVAREESRALQVAAPGGATFQLEAGDYTLYEDLPAGSERESAREDLSCSVEGPGGPAAVDRNPNTWSRIKTNLGTSVSFAAVEVLEPGPHAIKCHAGASTIVSLRRGGALSPMGSFGPLALAFALVMAAPATGLLVWRLRRRHGLDTAPGEAAGAGPVPPPAIGAHWEVAPLWRRSLALGINVAVALLLSGQVMGLFGLDSKTGMSWTPGGFHWTWIDGWPLQLTTLLTFIAYDAFLGGGPGKWLLGIRARDATGGKLSLAAACLRSLLKPLDLLSWGAVAIADPFHRSIADRVAGTLVVRKEPRLLSEPPRQPPGRSDRAVLGAMAGTVGALFTFFMVYGFAQWVQVDRISSATWSRLQGAIADGDAAEVRRLWSKKVSADRTVEFFQTWIAQSEEARKIRSGADARFTYWQRSNGQILVRGKTPEGQPFTVLFVSEEGEWKVDGFEVGARSSPESARDPEPIRR